MITTIIIMSMMVACKPTPDVIHIGQDECSYCRMIISEKPFATQIVTSKGKSYKFDSIECMAAYEVKNKPDIHSHWVNHVTQPDKTTELSNSIIVYSENVRSPMGLSLVAIPETAFEDFIKEVDGKILSWTETKAFVSKEWSVN